VKAGANTPGDDTKAMPGADSEDVVTRGVVFVLDPTPAQERLLRSYAGAAHRAHNWALDQVKRT
jgi:hypothetical protein